VNPEIDIASLRRLSTLSQQKLDKVGTPFQNCHQIASVHQYHHAPTRRVSLDAIVREPIDREEQSEGVVQLSRQLAREDVEVRCGHKVLLPLCLKEIVRAFEAEGAVDLLADNLK
jgi:hypothetical protein